MADHYRIAVTETSKVDELAQLITDLHSSPAGTSGRIAQAHQAHDRALQLAGVHATLAVAQALQDLRLGA